MSFNPLKKLTADEMRAKFVVKGRQSNFLPIDDMLGHTYQNLTTPPKSVRIEAMPKFSEITGGFRPREFSILCGSTGVGKTTFISNLSADLIRQGTSHYVASVETGALDFTRRVISSIINKDINHGDAISKDEIFSIHKRFGHVLKTDTLQLALYEDRAKIEDLKSDIVDAHLTHGTKIAVIDNLNFFMEVTKASDAIVEMDRVIHEMIIFCKQVDVHVIMIMHPKKNASNARDTRVESEFEIKGSSLAVQEAHNVFLLNRPKLEDVENGIWLNTDRELKIAKMRRNGRAIGSKLMFSSDNGVSFREKALVVP